MCPMVKTFERQYLLPPGYPVVQMRRRKHAAKQPSAGEQTIASIHQSGPKTDAPEPWKRTSTCLQLSSMEPSDG